MKRTTTLLVAALAVGCARPAYPTRSDAEAGGIGGGIERITETAFDFEEYHDDEPAVSTLSTITVVEYNRAGNITLTDVYQSADTIHVSREEYIYDPKGRVLERSRYLDPQRNRYTTTIYENDDRGHILSQRDEASGHRADYGYDRHGYLRTRVDTTDVENPIVTRYRYDRLGRLRLERSPVGGDPVIRYTYHGQSPTIRTVRTGKTETDTYDDRGNLVSMTSIVKHLESRSTRKGKMKWRVKEREPVTITAEYEYDERGNWIRREKFSYGRPVGLSVRELRYYGEGGR